MNKKSYIKIGILIVFGLCMCIGCSTRHEKYTLEELNNLAEIKIYSAENNELIETISDEEQLYQYNQCSLSFDNSDIEERQDELKKDLEGIKEQYYLVAYKYPAARWEEKELEENTTITLYENAAIIKMTVAEESIKAFSIPEEFLTFYYELSEEEIKFYRSLIE